MTKADEEIAECLAARTSFLLDAGAGAGKTYSLVQALRAVLKAHRKQLAANGQTIACITFTNVAKDQILERIGHDAVVRVSTIHDFLWEVIAPHQKALKAALLKFNAGMPDRSARKKDGEELAAALAEVDVRYSDTGSNFLKGRLFHDDLLGVARIMFADSPLLSRLTSARHSEWRRAAAEVSDDLRSESAAHAAAAVDRAKHPQRDYPARGQFRLHA